MCVGKRFTECSLHVCITSFFLPRPPPHLCLCLSLPLSLFLSLSPSSLFPRKNRESQFPTINCLQWGSYRILSDGRMVTDSTFYFETSHFELSGGTLPVRPAPSPAPYRQPSSIPRAGGRPEKRRTWVNYRNTRRVHVGPSQALVLNPTPASSGCIPHSFPKTRCSKAPNPSVRSGSPSLTGTWTLS